MYFGEDGSHSTLSGLFELCFNEQGLYASDQCYSPANLQEPTLLIISESNACTFDSSVAGSQMPRNMRPNFVPSFVTFYPQYPNGSHGYMLEDVDSVIFRLAQAAGRSAKTES